MGVQESGCISGRLPHDPGGFTCILKSMINVNFYQILVHVTVIFRNLIFVCITIKEKLLKHSYITAIYGNYRLHTEKFP